MEETKSNRSTWLHVRLTPQEYNQIGKFYGKSTCRKLSEYVRNRLLEKPVTVFYRDQSLDDFMTELIRLRSELNAIGSNFNQSVKKLHTKAHAPNFIHWISAHENERAAMLEKTEQIKNSIQKFAEQWLQSSRRDRP